MASRIEHSSSITKVCMGYHWSMYLMMYFGIPFFSWMTLLVWWDEGFGFYFLFFLACIAFNVYCLLTTLEKICVDSQGINVSTLFAKQFLGWDEIHSVHTNPFPPSLTNPVPSSLIGNFCVFQGDGKSINVHLAFKDKNRVPMRHLLAQQIIDRQIKLIAYPRNQI